MPSSRQFHWALPGTSNRPGNEDASKTKADRTQIVGTTQALATFIHERLARPPACGVRCLPAAMIGVSNNTYLLSHIEQPRIPTARLSHHFLGNEYAKSNGNQNHTLLTNESEN